MFRNLSLLPNFLATPHSATLSHIGLQPGVKDLWEEAGREIRRFLYMIYACIFMYICIYNLNIWIYDLYMYISNLFVCFMYIYMYVYIT